MERFNGGRVEARYDFDDEDVDGQCLHDDEFHDSWPSEIRRDEHYFTARPSLPLLLPHRLRPYRQSPGSSSNAGVSQ
jgi:hypothetical protein